MAPHLSRPNNAHAVTGRTRLTVSKAVEAHLTLPLAHALSLQQLVCSPQEAFDFGLFCFATATPPHQTMAVNEEGIPATWQKCNYHESSDNLNTYNHVTCLYLHTHIRGQEA